MPYENIILLDGWCFPLREHLKALGFGYTLDFMPNVDRWTAEKDAVDLDETASLFTEWGWKVINCTHINDDE